MVVPVVGSGVTSPTVKIPNCIVPLLGLDSFKFNHHNGMGSLGIPALTTCVLTTASGYSDLE
jgi:hypothetical protein